MKSLALEAEPGRAIRLDSTVQIGLPVKDLLGRLGGPWSLALGGEVRQGLRGQSKVCSGFGPREVNLFQRDQLSSYGCRACPD